MFRDSVHSVSVLCVVGIFAFIDVKAGALLLDLVPERTGTPTNLACFITICIAVVLLVQLYLTHTFFKHAIRRVPPDQTERAAPTAKK